MSARNELTKLKTAFDKEILSWQQGNKIERLWKGDASLWTNQDETEWLGWLNIIEQMQNEIPSLNALKKIVETIGFKYIVLLGMGGSSLCPAVLAETFGTIEGNPKLLVLDSTDPIQIQNLEEQLELQRTLFIVSSKSGSTLEPNIFKDYFYAKLQHLLGHKNVGGQFIAITDPGSKLENIALDDNFRAIFHGNPSIGGRYSALSNFGIVPACLMGIDIKDFLYTAETMRQVCLPTSSLKNNPGVILGIILGVSAKQGMDKITLVMSPAIRALGAWLEQLLAESMGKMGKGLIPIDLEPLGEPYCYANDRLFIYIRLVEALDSEQEAGIKALEAAGYTVISLTLQNKQQLASEFFRWELATAVAGSILEINPFNQPDVEGSKVLAVKLLTEYQKNGKIQKPKLLFTADRIQLLTDERNAKEINANLTTKANLSELLKAHLNRLKLGDYVNLSAFIAMSNKNMDLLQECRVLIRDNKKVATCLGFGPRFLHSTGQAYKGGPNTGIFLQITAEEGPDLQIPGHDYSFAVVIQAQAEADFEVLVERGRRVLRVHLRQNVAAGLQELREALKKALTE